MYVKIGTRKLFLSTNEVFALIFIPFLVCVLAVILTNLKSVYQIEAIIYPGTSSVDKIQRGALKGLNRSLRRLMKTQHRQNEQDSFMDLQANLAILQSPHLIENYILEYNLKPKLFPKRWDEYNQSWRKAEKGVIGSVMSFIRNTFSDLTGKKINPSEPEIFKAIEMLSNKLDIKSNDQTRLITVKLKWEDPVIGAELVNKLINYANQFIAKKEQRRILQEINNIQKLLINEELAVMRKVLFKHMETLQSSLSMSDASLKPAFKILSRAKIPEEILFKLPIIKLVLLFTPSIVFTLLGLSYKRHKKYLMDVSVKSYNEFCVNDSNKNISAKLKQEQSIMIKHKVFRQQQ